MTVPQKRFLEALGLCALGAVFGLFLLAAAQLDTPPKPAWLVIGYMAGLATSTILAVWRLILFFKS
jgi:hypothetical protein